MILLKHHKRNGASPDFLSVYTNSKPVIWSIVDQQLNLSLIYKTSHLAHLSVSGELQIENFQIIRSLYLLFDYKFTMLFSAVQMLKHKQLRPI